MRFPNNEQGIKAAQRVAGPEGDWAGYVDWWGDVPEEKKTEEAMRSAVAAGADIAPSALTASEVTIEMVPDIATFAQPQPQEPGVMTYAEMRRDLPA